MLSVSTALARLQDGLGESFPDSPGTRIIDVAFPLNDAFDPLLWCGQQAQWPQFYWQQRNGDEELATLGAVKTFTSLDAANRFLRQAGRQDLRICGLNAFEPQQGSLALPRLEWRRCGGRAVLRLVLHSDISLREDAATARAFLASLTTTQATPGAIPPLLSERHSSDYPQWQAMIARATKAISAGEMDKVVLARATDLQFAAPLDAVSIMAASRRSNLNCFHFLMAFNARQAFFRLHAGTAVAPARRAAAHRSAGGDRREPSGRREGAATGRLVDERRQKPAGKHAGGRGYLPAPAE